MQSYPTPAGAQRSAVFEVTAGGSEVFVEHWREVSYTRFAIDAPIAIAIRAPHPVHEVEVLPRAAVSDVVVDGDALRFMLRRPANVVVRVAGLERLFVCADAEEEAPVVGAPGVRSVAAYGADATGAQLATAALQRALDDAAVAGGTVVVPAGTYVTGTLVIRSRVTLYLAAGAVLRGSDDPADYPIDAGRRESGSDASIESPEDRYLGETMTFSRLVLFDDAVDAHLAGRGTLDGHGTHLRQVRGAVPNLIRVRGGHDITIRDVLLRDAAAWTLHILGAHHVTVENVRIVNERSNLNTDGIDPDASQDVVVRGCLIWTKDDGVCVKASHNSGIVADVARVEVTGNVVSSVDAAFKVGSESRTPRIADVTFRDNDVFDSGRAVSIVLMDGACYARLHVRDLRVTGVAHLIEQVIAVRPIRPVALGVIEDLQLEDVEVIGYARPADNWTWYAQFRPDGQRGRDLPVFQGGDAAHPVRGLVLRNVVVNGVRLRDRETAARVANLTIGPFVDDVEIE